MRVVGIIPARYESSRLPGKPLADICGKPMIWWVYRQAKKVDELSDVIVAADHPLVYATCEEYGIPYVETLSSHPSHVHRLMEVSEKIQADAYVCICGDEPMIEPEVIASAIPCESEDISNIYVRGVYRKLSSPTEVIDTGNIKIITDANGKALALSRTPIPTPYKTIEFSYKKTIGIECFNKEALRFYAETEKQEWERIEDIMMLRFIENHIPVYFKEVKSNSISVDTEKDLEHVRLAISQSEA